MNVRDNSVYIDLINAKHYRLVYQLWNKPIVSVYGSNESLAEITQKVASALGQGGLSRERAGFKVRDVHYTTTDVYVQLK
jgi:DNA-directed RNA polymerase beta subunit